MAATRLRRAGPAVSAPVPVTGAGGVLAAAGVGGIDPADYSRRQRRFHHLLETGSEPGPYLLVAHTLVDDAQVPSGPRRRDLGELYAMLREVIDDPAVLDAVLSAVVEPAALAAFGVVVEFHDETTTVARIVHEGGRNWPAALGGTNRRGEIERWVTITARRAGWRDRQVRRLARVQVESVELHPDPAGAPRTD